MGLVVWVFEATDAIASLYFFIETEEIMNFRKKVLFYKQNINGITDNKNSNCVCVKGFYMPPPLLRESEIQIEIQNEIQSEREGLRGNVLFNL